MPKISVIMPVYNTKEEYLREAIESILNQSYADFEFIILNDGSTNNSEEVILSYKDRRIRYIKNETNLGLSKTRNKLLELANEDWIAFMDSDDIALPTRFERQIAFLESNQDVDILGTWFEMFPNKRIVKHPTADDKIKEYLLFLGSAIGNPTVMIRKAILEKNSLKYNEKDTTAEDYSLWLSIIDKAKFANLPEVLLNYRCHETNDSVVNSSIQKNHTIKLKLKAQEFVLKIDAEKISQSFDKIALGQKINARECINSIAYLEKLIDKMPTSENKELYIKEAISIYKTLVKNTRRDISFLLALWENKINKLIKNSLYFRLKNSIRGWGQKG